MILSYPPVRVARVGRPKTYGEDRVATAVRLPVSVHERLRRAADDRDVSANLLVTRAVTEYLDRLCGVDALLNAPPAQMNRAEV